MYIRFTAFSNFSKLLFVLHILAFTKFLLRSCSPCQLWQTMFRSSFPILRTMYMRFKVFSNLSILLFVLHILTFTKFLLRWCAPCSLWKPSLRQHFHHSAHCVYQIYSVLKILEITVCLEHLGFYEISTPVVRTMLTMPNIIYINISNTP